MKIVTIKKPHIKLGMGGYMVLECNPREILGKIHALSGNYLKDCSEVKNWLKNRSTMLGMIYPMDINRND